MEILQITAVGIIGTILSITLKKQSPEFSLIVGIITGILIFIFISSKLTDVLAVIKSMADTAGINSAYLGIVIKIIGIAYIAEFGMQICQDAGASSVASKIELGGKVLIMLVATPVILALMDMVINMIT